MIFIYLLGIIAIAAFIVIQHYGWATVSKRVKDWINLTGLIPGSPSVGDYDRSNAYNPPTKAPVWESKTPVWESKTTEITITKKIADKTIPLVDRLNLRYGFADVKINEKLKLMTWKNFAGKKMQGPFDQTTGDPWRKACTLIEDSLHDTKKAKPRKKKPMVVAGVK
jgi:hypothetical protein